MARFPAATDAVAARIASRAPGEPARTCSPDERVQILDRLVSA